MFPQITQGAVLINSFDPAIGAGNYDIEMVVLVNRTSSNIDLNGYEILCYNFNAIPHTPAFWQFTASYILPPYRFLLITRNTNNVSGVSADLVRIQYGGQIDYDGYLAFKKINATNPSDFVDIVSMLIHLLIHYISLLLFLQIPGLICQCRELLLILDLISLISREAV